MFDANFLRNVGNRNGFLLSTLAFTLEKIEFAEITTREIETLNWSDQHLMNKFVDCAMFHCYVKLTN